MLTKLLNIRFWQNIRPKIRPKLHILHIRYSAEYAKFGFRSDSRDEVSAALFVYGKNLDFGSNKTAVSVVDQVDLVPTFSLLMGIPIPFSNLGRVIRGLWSGAAQADSLLRYV